MQKCDWRQPLTHDLTDARHQQITTLGENRPILFTSDYLLHVERLDLSRESVQKHGCPNNVGHLSLGGLGDIITNDMVDHPAFPVFIFDDITFGVLFFVLNPMIVEPLDGVDI
jgi:hypothetical protein